MNQANMNRSINQTLADYVKESAAWQNSLSHHHQQQQQQQAQNQHQQIASTNHATSLPWAAAVKAAEHQQQQQHHMGLSANQSAFERSSTIGSWSSPETSSSVRGGGGSGWNADGTAKSNGAPDDGTAIWGNPTVKKTGIDWAEKESQANPTQASSSSSGKRTPKAEPIISSINGTEAWGAPASSALGCGVGSLSSSSSSAMPMTNSQQQLPKLSSLSNENSGNIYGTKSKPISNEPLGWGESSSSSISSLQQGNHESSSSPLNNSIWNHLTNTNGSSQHQKASADWLSSSSSGSSAAGNAQVNNNTSSSSSRIDELNKQLEGTSLFDALSSSSSPPSSSSNANKNSSSNCVSAPLGGIGSGNTSNSINDLKQMSAKFINSNNDLIINNDVLRRPPMNNAMSPATSITNQQQSQQQMNAYPSGIAPSRDLLKQMVHQIQLAVQAGHLNAQILNQPMSTPTLQLVYTLLQQIKLLQQLQEVQQRTANNRSSPSSDHDTNNLSSCNLDPQMSRVQQNISLLQKAITQQQAALTKNEALANLNSKQQQQQQAAAANNFSYANISKLSTNTKVPPDNISNTISNNSIDSFKRGGGGGLIDSLTGNTSSDSQRLAHQANHNSIEANEIIDKTLSPSLLQSSVNNILMNNNKARSFASVSSANQQQLQQQQQQQQQEAQKMMSAQSPPSSAGAWLAFNSGDLVSSPFSSGWPTRTSAANVSQHDQQQQQQQQLNSDLLSEYVNSRGSWRTGSDNIAQTSQASLAPGANMNLAARQNPSSSNSMRQMGDTNDILSKESSPYYDWGASNSDSFKRNFDSAPQDPSPVSSLSPPALGGLSLQSNHWLFAPAGRGADTMLSKSSTNNFGGVVKHDNGDVDKMTSDSMNYLRSNNTQQRSASALYDQWGNIGSMQYNSEPAPIGSKQAISNSSSNAAGRQAALGAGNGSRPAPPPGLMSNFGSFMGGDAGNGRGSRSTNEMSSLDTNKLGNSGDEGQLASRDSSASLWSGTWFD